MKETSHGLILSAASEQRGNALPVPGQNTYTARNVHLCKCSCINAHCLVMLHRMKQSPSGQAHTDIRTCPMQVTKQSAWLSCFCKYWQPHMQPASLTAVHIISLCILHSGCTRSCGLMNKVQHSVWVLWTTSLASVLHSSSIRCCTLMNKVQHSVWVLWTTSLASILHSSSIRCCTLSHEVQDSLWML